MARNYRASVDSMNKEDLYSTSERQYFFETTHGVYPAGAFFYVAGFDDLAEGMQRARSLDKKNPGQYRLVNRQREVLFPATAVVA